MNSKYEFGDLHSDLFEVYHKRFYASAMFALAMGINKEDWGDLGEVGMDVLQHSLKNDNLKSLGKEKLIQVLKSFYSYYDGVSPDDLDEEVLEAHKSALQLLSGTEIICSELADEPGYIDQDVIINGITYDLQYRKRTGGNYDFVLHNSENEQYIFNDYQYFRLGKILDEKYKNDTTPSKKKKFIEYTAIALDDCGEVFKKSALDSQGNEVGKEILEIFGEALIALGKEDLYQTLYTGSDFS